MSLELHDNLLYVDFCCYYAIGAYAAGMNNDRITVLQITVPADASGVIALLAYDGADRCRYKFACYWLGETRLHLVGPVSGSRRESKAAARACEAAFDQLVQMRTTAAWRERCKTMYASDGQAVVL